MHKTGAAFILALALGAASDAGAQTMESLQSQSRARTPPPPKHAAKRPKPCLHYGEGFYYLPGTDTCVKVNGYVRSDVIIGGGGGGGAR
jgi:hypothetical protein